MRRLVTLGLQDFGWQLVGFEGRRCLHGRTAASGPSQRGQPHQTLSLHRVPLQYAGAAGRPCRRGSGSQRRSASPSSPSSPRCSSSLSPRWGGRPRPSSRSAPSASASCFGEWGHPWTGHRRAGDILVQLVDGAGSVASVSPPMTRNTMVLPAGLQAAEPRTVTRASTEGLGPLASLDLPMATRLQTSRRRGEILEQGVKEARGRLVHLTPRLRESAYCSPVRAVSIRSSRAVSMKVSLGLAIRVLTRAVWP